MNNEEKKWTTLSITKNNRQEVMAIAAKISDDLGVPVSANTAVEKMIERWKETEK